MKKTFAAATATILFFASLLFCTTVKSQLTSAKLEEHFNHYNSNLIQEKLFMHVDRNFYLAGEILWCKIYVVDAMQHRPLDLSKVAYLEVLDENNTPVLQAKLKLSDGKGNGSVSIPVSIKSGNYHLRAYTNWMKNAGPDYFFEKMITVVNTQKNREITATAKPNVVPDIHFFPEGGNLVSGIVSKLACKVTGPDGKGISFSGTVVDENNRSVTNFQSLRSGMGNFDFTPEAGHTYHAVMEINRSRYTKELPEIFSKGYVMQVNPNGTSFAVTVQTNVAESGKLFLLVHTRQSLKTVMEASIEKGKAVFSVDAGKLGDGISQFTILTADGKPVCERLRFVYPEDQLSIGVTGNRQSYATRSEIDLLLQPTVQNKKINTADLSVAVYKLDELQGIDENNIQTFLWLASDLKGQVESPGFYFSKDPAAPAAMDNLMLTQGWRRFKWDDILGDRTPAIAFMPEYNGHILTGKVTGSLTGLPLDNTEIYVSAPGFNGNVRTYITDSTGRVKFDFKDMRGSSELIIQTAPTADSNARVEIANPFYEQYIPFPMPAFRLSAKNENLLHDQNIGVQAQNAFYGTLLKKYARPPDTVSIFAKPDASYMIDDYTRFTTMEEVLREYVTRIDVQKSRGNFSIKMYNDFPVPSPDMANKNFFATEPLVLVDGVPVFSIDRLMSYDPLKMRKLEVYNRQFFMGASYFAGVLNWSTYKGDYGGLELDPHALVIDYEGLQPEREFYSPVYDAASRENSHAPDFRTLLYWSHDIIPDAKGEQHVRFYTSDRKGKYVAIIQGLNSDGRCGIATTQFEIK